MEFAHEVFCQLLVTPVYAFLLAATGIAVPWFWYRCHREMSQELV